MNNDTFSNALMRQKKKDIIKLLKKEGIEPNEKQGKEELIKLLNLARKANEPSRLTNRKLIRTKGVRPTLLVLLTILVVSCVFALYELNPTFNRNVNFLVSLIEVDNLDQGNPNEPKILEKNGKTYVVYNHPLVGVEVFYDSSCKRPECEIDSYINKIKTGISPLINLRMVDVSDVNFSKKTEDLDITMLPTFAFNKTVEKLGNFDQLKDNFINNTNNTYLLQFPPYRVINLPEKNNSSLLFGESESDVEIYAYLSLSTKQSIDTLVNLAELSSAYNNASVYLKYFYRNETDEKIALALGCASGLESFNELFTQIVNNNSSIISADSARFRTNLNSYVSNAGINNRDFFACYDEDNQQIIESIANSKLEFNEFGVVGAPTVLVGRKSSNSAGVIIGYYEKDNFMKLADDILRQEFNNSQTND